MHSDPCFHRNGAREDLRALTAEMRQETLDGLRQSREQVQQFAPEVATPVDGTVQQLVVHTVAGVVTPAQPLLAVVPSEQALEVEATVLNKDIGFVRKGQSATIKIESFPYTRYGYMRAWSKASRTMRHRTKKWGWHSPPASGCARPT